MGRLTDLTIRKAKPGARAYKLTDGDGLHLLVTPSGGKLWRLQYRFDGKQKTLSFGSYPVVSLSEARDKRIEARKLLVGGHDPSIQKKIEKTMRAATAANTFNLIADEYLEKFKREGHAEATITKITWLIAFARAPLGIRPVSEISPVEVLAVLRRVEARGKLETARRLRSTLSSVFRYAMATARATADPTYALKGALTRPKIKSRAAIVDPIKLGGLLRAIDSLDGQPTTALALKLMALLFPRPGELRLAEWHEFDTAAAVWNIPAEHTKMRRSHKIPLPRQALAILEQLHKMTGFGKLVIHSVRTAREPISENTLNAALRRLGYGTEEMTAHGFRAAAASLLNESRKWHPDAVERQLAHVESNDVRRAYVRGEHWDERVKMMAWWANYLDELKAVAPGKAAA